MRQIGQIGNGLAARLRGVTWRAACVAFVAGFVAQAQAAGTAAGTNIQNVAQVSYQLGASTITTASNVTSINVAEIVNVNVTPLTASVSVATGASNQALMFRVTNTGNGPEKFHLTLNSAIVGDDFDPVPAATSIYFDTDGTPGFSAGDTPYTPGGNDPLLQPDGSVVVLVLNNIPAALADGAKGKSDLNAAAFTGTGSPGTIFAGQGTGGVDAVIGTSGGKGNAEGVYVVGALQLNSVKSQTVADPFGGTEPVPGATITYQIVVTPAGSGTANAAVLSDPIPSNTSFVSGSLKLNGTTLSDAADADAGQYTISPAPQVRVNLGNLTAASGPQTVVFKVTIN